MNDKDAKKITAREKRTLKEIHDELDRLTSVGVDALNDAEKGFIRARASYLSEGQEKLFDSVLNEKTEEPTTPEPNSMEDLRARAEKVGVTYKTGTKREDFQTQVEEAEKDSQNNN